MPEADQFKSSDSFGKDTQDQIPIQDLQNIQKTMNELFSDLFSGRPIRAVGAQESWQPSVDIYENQDMIYILVDVPGMSSKDISIVASPETIIVKGERRAGRKVEDQDYILREHYHGSFSRTIPLPYPIKPREIKAIYRDGTLELRLPRAKSNRGKSVKVDLE